MKKMIALLTIVISTNIFAYSLVDSTLLTSALPLLSSASTSDTTPEKQAQIVLNDAQAFFQDGSLSVFLSQKIKDAQSINKGISEADALEMLINEAQAILK